MADSPVDFRTSVYQTLIGKGLSPQQAMGVMYSLMGESGHGLDPSSYNPNDPGGAMGFAQWVGPRRAGLQATAKSMGLDEKDPSAQLAYFQQEINGKYANVIDNIKKNALSAADATKIWTGDFEGPAVNNWAQRYAAGAKIGSIDENGAPKWNTAPVASSGAPAAPGGASPATGPPTSVGDALTRLTTPDDKTGKSALQDLSTQLSSARQQGGGMRESAPMLAGGGGAPAGAGMLAGPSGQLMQQIIAASGKPLSWSSAPYGTGTAGPQIPGMTLNSNPYGGYLG